MARKKGKFGPLVGGTTYKGISQKKKPFCSVKPCYLLAKENYLGQNDGSFSETSIDPKITAVSRWRLSYRNLVWDQNRNCCIAMAIAVLPSPINIKRLTRDF